MTETTGIEPELLRRRRWIAASMRIEVRPLAYAALVRSRGGEPPALPLRDDMGSGSSPAAEFQALRAAVPSEADVDALERSLLDRRIEVRTPEDGGWLERFWSEMEDPPPALYIRGRLHDPGTPAVAIVGARHATENGLALARSIARDLAMEGVVIVSGLAFGIDAAAHRGALDAGGWTVAVLGGGVDQPSPTSHAELAADILEDGGALASEFPPGTRPRPLHFPRRNRVLAALASVLVVVEGGKRSGARSTVDHALAMGRDVAAVPRDPIHENSALPNRLLHSGAAPVRDAHDVLDLLQGVQPSPIGQTGSKMPPPARTVTSSLGLFDDLERRILDTLASRSRRLDALARSVGCSSAEALAALGRLEASAYVRRLPGLQYARSGRGT